MHSTSLKLFDFVYKICISKRTSVGEGEEGEKGKDRRRREGKGEEGKGNRSKIAKRESVGEGEEEGEEEEGKGRRGEEKEGSVMVSMFALNFTEVVRFSLQDFHI